MYYRPRRGYIFNCKVCGGKHRSTSEIGKYHMTLGILFELRSKQNEVI